MMYERKVDIWAELLQQISDIAGHVNKTAVPRKVTYSLVKRIGLCIQAEGGHFEQLSYVNCTLYSFPSIFSSL
jgi:hypothetical protein